VILGFFAGVFGANGVRHFVEGITKESYPCVFGNSPVPSLIAGWFSSTLFGHFADLWSSTMLYRSGSRPQSALSASASFMQRSALLGASLSGSPSPAMASPLTPCGWRVRGST